MTADCGLIREIISGAIDGVFLDDSEQQTMEQHLANCAECRAHKAALEDAVSLLAAVPLPFLDPGLDPKAFPKLTNQGAASSPINRTGDRAVGREAFLAKLGQSLDNKPVSSRSPMQGESCEDFNELLSGSLDEALLPSEEALLARHLQACAACKQRQSEYLSLQSTLEGFAWAQPSPDFLLELNDCLDACARLEREELSKQLWQARLHATWHSVRQNTGWLARVAAAVLLLFGSLAFLQYMTKRRRNPRITKNNPDRQPPNDSGQEPKTEPKDKPKPKDQGKVEQPPLKQPDLAHTEPKDKPGPKPQDHIPNPEPKDPEPKPGPPKKQQPKDTGTQDREPEPKRPALDEAALALLINQIKDRRVSVARRQALVRKLGEYPHPKSYQLLNGVMVGRFQDYPGANHYFESACEAAAKLDSKESADILWQAPIQAGRELIDPIHVVRNVARLRNKQAIASLAQRASRDLSGQRPFAVLAGLGWRNNHIAGQVLTAELGERKSRALNNDQAAELHREMAIVMGRIGHEGSFEVLSNLASSKVKSHALVREGATEALGFLQGKDCVGALTEPLKDRNALVRASAARSLARYDDPEAISLMIKRLGKERSSRVKASIHESLFRLTGQTHGSFKAWKSWWKRVESQVRGPKDVNKMRPKGALPVLKDEVFGMPFRPRRLLILLDASASMAYSGKFKRAVDDTKKALTVLYKKSRGRGVFVNVLVFADTVKRLIHEPRQPLVELNLKNLQHFHRRLDAQKTSQRPTNLLQTFEKAFQFGDFGSLYLVSDGAATSGQVDIGAVMRGIKRLNSRRRVSIHCVAVYDGQRPSFLDFRDKVKGNEGQYKNFLRRLSQDNHGFFVGNNDKDPKKVKKARKKPVKNG